MIRRLLTLVLIGAWGLLAAEGRAQDTLRAQQDTLAVSGDTVVTTATPQSQQVRYQYVRYRRPKLSSVAQVRRRLDRIGVGGGDDGSRLIVYPYPYTVVVPVTPQTAQQAPGAPASTPAAGLNADDLRQLESRLGQRIDRRVVDLYNLLRDSDQPPLDLGAVDGGRDEIEVHLPGDEPPAEEEEPADEVVPPRREPQRQPTPRVPTVRQVERAILETGLFRAAEVNFEFDKSTLLPPSEPILDAVGEVLAKYPALRVEVAGHTDAIGPADYNQRLSGERAGTVKQYLVDNFSIQPERLPTVGYGESRPIASNENPTGRTLNRRVEFRVLNPEAAEQYTETDVPADEEQLRETLRRTIREELERFHRQQTDSLQNGAQDN